LRTRLARDRRNQQPAPWCWFGAELELESQGRKAKIVRLRECGAEWRTHRSRAGGRECCGKLACHVTLWSSRSLGDDRQDGAGHHTGAACVDLCDQASCGPHVRAWCAHSRYAKSGGRFHPCRPGVEPRRCGVGRDAKHWGSFNEALSTVATRRAISARSRIPRKNLFQAGLALSRAECQSRRRIRAPGSPNSRRSSPGLP
jgi:hypothetical protein